MLDSSIVHILFVRGRMTICEGCQELLKITFFRWHCTKLRHQWFMNLYPLHNVIFPGIFILFFLFQSKAQTFLKNTFYLLLMALLLECSEELLNFNIGTRNKDLWTFSSFTNVVIRDTKNPNSLIIFSNSNSDVVSPSLVMLS